MGIGLGAGKARNCHPEWRQPDRRIKVASRPKSTRRKVRHAKSGYEDYERLDELD